MLSYMNLQLIRRYADNDSGVLRQLAVDVGMSEANLRHCIRNNKIQTSDLETLLQHLNVGIEIPLLTMPKRKKRRGNSQIGHISCVA